MSFVSEVTNDSLMSLNGGEETKNVSTITPPDIVNKVEEMSGLGISNYEAVIAGLFETMTTTVKFNGLSPDVTLSDGSAFNLIITSAIQGTNDEDGSTMFVKDTRIIKGVVKSVKTGDIGRGLKAEPEVEVSTRYYKHEFDGVVKHEIDVFNRVATINGKDVREKIKTILGV